MPGAGLIFSKQSDFAGHSKRTFNSLDVGPKKDACIKVMPSQPQVPEGYFNNTCIQVGYTGNATAPPAYASINGCNGTTGKVDQPRELPVMHNNRIFNPWGAATVSCAEMTPPYRSATMSMAAFQEQGYEKGSTIGTTPPVHEIVAIAERILGF